MNSKNLYLYCIGEVSENEDQPRLKQEQALQLKGLAGGEVFAFLNHPLVAVVQECDSPFSSGDSQTVSQWVLTHQAVVDQAWEEFGSVIPFNFDTLVVPKEGKSARENLVNWMVKEEGPLRRRLEKLKGKAEYGIQVSWDPNLIASKVTQKDLQIQQLEEEIHGKGAGAQYLLQHKKKDVLKCRLEMAADAYFREFYESITRLVEEVHVEKVRKEEPPRQMLMNLSCLLPKGDISKLDEALEKIAKITGFFVRFTGPWPPYSFAKL